MAYAIEKIGGQGWWILRQVSESLTMMRDGQRVPMGEVLYQGTKAGCVRAQAVYTLMHAMRYIDRHCEFSPANGSARRILENLLLDVLATSERSSSHVRDMGINV